jgi:hypothetical protein
MSFLTRSETRLPVSGRDPEIADPGKMGQHTQLEWGLGGGKANFESARTLPEILGCVKYFMTFFVIKQDLIGLAIENVSMQESAQEQARLYAPDV